MNFRSLLVPPRREVWDVDGALTTTLIWKSRQKTNNLLFFIPGNPGLIEYYQEFLQCVYACSNACIDIIGVQHAGHSQPNVKKELNITSDKPSVTILSNNLTDKQLFMRRNGRYTWGLQDQIEHKRIILDYLMEQNSRSNVIIAGHSIGSFVATQLLKNIPSDRVMKVINLFPTVENIRNTPNGNQLFPLFDPIGRSLVSSLTYLLQSSLSSSHLKQLVTMVTSQTEEEAEITVKLIHPNVAMNTLYMAEHEMNEIRDLDIEVFDNHAHKMIFYYGMTDGWVPLDRYHNMVNKYPQATVYLCNHNLPHAFVLGGDGSYKMGQLVSDWISQVVVQGIRWRD